MKNNITFKSLFIALSMVVCLVFCVPLFSLAWETKDPELAKASAEMLGFKTKDKVGNVAPDIKPGLVIDSSNYQDYPGLKELMLPSLYARMKPDAYAPLAPIKIKETDQYHLSKGWIEKTLRSAKTTHIGEDGLSLEEYVGGHPFLHPKSGVELVQWADNPYLGDSFGMRPMRLRLYGRDNKPEREMRQHLNVIRYTSCTDWRPEGIQPNQEEINYVVSGVFTYPRDISGTSYVRKRFLSPDRSDEFLLYVASMRRIRRMSGRDTQDPLFGSDLAWDDYNMYWQKLSLTEFPNEYKMLPSRELLVPTYIDYNYPDDRSSAGYTDYYIDESGDQVYLHFGSFQRRWVHMLEVISKDPNYAYGKRIMALEPTVCVNVTTEMYDQSGRLWRSWVPRDYNLCQAGGGIMEDFNDIVDHINNHRTILDFKGHRNPRWMGEDFADVRFLSRKSK